ncbi:hypothetical protein HPC49_19495, partial [Pyxidicoccus fallax]
VTFARKPWRTGGPFVTGYVPALVTCLEAHRERHGLEWGVADYWDARLVSLFSRTGMWVNPVSAEGHTSQWIMNVDWYLDRRGEQSDYTFVITRQLDAAAIQRRFGAPRATFQCDGAEVFVYGEGLDPALRDGFAGELKRPRR